MTHSGPRASRGLDLEKHPDKTFIGRTERGFDFLGYHFGPEGLTMAAKTIEQFVERALRLYEQEPGAASNHSRFGTYVRRWVGWAEEGLQEGTNSRPSQSTKATSRDDDIWWGRACGAQHGCHG